MFSFMRKSKAVSSTPFSEFIRNASSAEKKRVYKRVLEKASESQNRILARAAAAKWAVPIPSVSFSFNPRRLVAVVLFVSQAQNAASPLSNWAFPPS